MTPPGRLTPTAARPRDWLALAVLALPTLLVSVDVSVMLLALPHIGAVSAPPALSSCGSWTCTGSWWPVS